MAEGYLEIILGPMFAGKTTKLIEKYRECIFLSKKVCVINYEEDKRYDNEKLSSHDLIKIDSVNLKQLSDIFDNNENLDAEVFLINEGQFFKDLDKVVIHLVENMKKSVYIYGLDGDYKRERFGKMLDLIPLSNKVEKLTALCNICRDGTKAYFTKRITKDTSQKLIGTDNHIAVCRNCYNN
jgi:thymidine kinase